MPNPSTRTKALLLERGYSVAKVEQRLLIPGKFVTKDAFGFADFLAFAPGRKFLLVQTTTGANLAARITKAQAIPEFNRWLVAGGEIEFHGWAKRGPRNEKKVWTCDVRRYPLDSDKEEDF